MVMGFTDKSLVLLAIALSPCAFSQAGLVGEKSLDGKIRFQAVEDFQIEGSHRVRLMPAGAARVTPEGAKRFPREELAQIGTIRADGAHRLVRLDEAGKVSGIVLPENFAPKTALDAATAQGRLTIQVFQSKKSKTGELIAPESFFVFVAGAEPDRLALGFINHAAAFADLDEQLAAMEGFAASFPDSPLKAEFRAQLLDRIANGAAAFEDRGAYSDLLLTRRFAELARRAFAGDGALDQLYTTIVNRIQTVESTRLTLRSLAAAGEWDGLLVAYGPFERYQWSFPDMMALRQTALEESARLHAHRGTLLGERQQYSDAILELTLAARRDPDNREIAKLLETTRVVASLAEAGGAKRRVLPPGSPQDLRFKRSLHDAERAIEDKDYAKADTSIQGAQAENRDAPEILVVQAKLLAARDRHAEALPLLDAYDRAVADPAARELGNAARNDILYDLGKKRTAIEQQLRSLQHDGDYSKLRAAANRALALDPEDDVFLYFGGATAALFRDAGARERLEGYLLRSDSLRGDPQMRDRAFRIRALLDAATPSTAAGTPRRVTPSFTPPGAPQPVALPAPNPASVAVTPNWLSGRPLPEGVYYCPVSAAFQLPIDSIAGYKLRMSFQWDRNRLTAITSTFDDEKGQQNYRAMGGPGDSQGNFFFAYPGTDTQVQAASTRRFEGPVTLPEVRVQHQAPDPPHLVDEHGLPRIVLRDSPQFNAAVLAALEGPVATGIAGNSFFNPFLWDGLHYFTLTYDAQGRLASAREWNADNLVRFAWSADRLTGIQAFRKDSPTPYYQRSISYSGAMIAGESYTLGNKVGQIKYVYSGKVLQQVKVEDGGVHDGKTWTVRMR
jgi:hypothetical protein